MIEAAILTLLAAPVLLRVGHVAHQLRRDCFGCRWRFQGFALGYALLGGLTIQLLIDTWRGLPLSWMGVGFVAASALLIIFDRRSE
jgi:hypothetical protein